MTDTAQAAGDALTIGAGCVTGPGQGSELRDGHVSIDRIVGSTSTIRVSVIIDDAHVDDAVRAVHAEFGLGADAVLEEQGAG